MVPRRDDAFPIDAARDLLGVVRSLYAEAVTRGAGAVDLQRIARVGRALDDAIGLAASHPPGTVGHCAAWRKGEQAARDACGLVDCLMGAEAVVTAARARVRRG
jgi:hypothetical protein